MPMTDSGKRRLRFHLFLGCLVLVLAGCTSPRPTSSPLHLPTRIPPTPTLERSEVALRAYEAGLARRAAGDVEGALEQFSRALVADPAFAPAYVERGSLYLALEEPEAALLDAQAALASDPGDGFACALLGEVLRLGFNDVAQALEAYEQAVRLDPSLAGPLFPARWRAAVAAGRADRMVALANEYLNAYPDDPLAAYYLGRALTALGNPRAAIRTLVDALEEGGPAAVWFALGEAYRAERAWPEAKVCYEQARALAETGDPSLNLVSDTPVADLFTGLGAAYVYVGECTSARVMLEHALAVGPDRPEMHTLLGQAMICQTPTPTPTPYPWMNP
ncbi:MAG TPA: tetratricopeptide repeat protein [Chloroflexi bacterium]|nr:tetratricopeptide repeat protein [Chloroflexota bacterium]